MPGAAVFTVSELTARIKEAPRGRVSGGLGRGRDLQSARAHVGARLLHAEGRAGPAALRPLPEPGAARALRGSRTGSRSWRSAASTSTPVRGEYQLVVELLEPKGLGALQLAFEQLKEKLEAEGLFDAGTEAPAAAAFRGVIGIVTSPTGAALRDILHIVARRFARPAGPRCPVRVQGDEAPREIAAALGDLVRGGRPRRGDRGPRRGVDRGPVGVQRGAGRPRHRGLPRAGHLRGRPRDRLHDRRLRGRPARADAVGRRRAGRAGEARTWSARSASSTPGSSRPCAAQVERGSGALALPRPPARPHRPRPRAPGVAPAGGRPLGALARGRARQPPARRSSRRAGDKHLEFPASLG